MSMSGEVHNFMETLTLEEFAIRGISDRYDQDYVQDLFCLTLNNLKPHYVRFSLDVRMNMTPDDRTRLTESVSIAIAKAHRILLQNRRGEERAV